MRVTVHLGDDDAGPCERYMVVASSAHEAVLLMADDLGLRCPWWQIDINMLKGQRAEGPPRVLGPVSGEAEARN